MVGFALQLRRRHRSLSYGNVILHIPREDLRDLGIAMQSVAEGAERALIDHHLALKKGLVQ